MAVVGHVESVEFITVPRLPLGGEVLHATGSFIHAAGGGGVVAVVLAELGAEVDFFCGLGDDPPGRAAAQELGRRGVNVHAAWRDCPTRRAVTLLEDGGERTIVTIGERLAPRGSDQLPWDRLTAAAGAYFTAGDLEALQHARQARTLVASPRGRAALTDEHTVIDALIFSARDRDECDWAERIGTLARLRFATDGGRGGRWWGESEGTWSALPAPGQVHDSYGCGDSFAAGVTFGLGRGDSVKKAVRIGAECGARTLTRSGPYAPAVSKDRA
ncbi:MAG: PfkB family carbohydrate kinase [Solirubrobacteraceae bacterium]